MGQDDRRTLLHQERITIHNQVRSIDHANPDSQGKVTPSHGPVREGSSQRVRTRPGNPGRGEPSGDTQVHVKQQLK